MVPLDIGPASPWRRRFAFRAGAVVAGIITALVLAECVARAFFPVEPSGIPRDSRKNAALVDNRRNALGLREPWDVVPGDDSTVRIAFLGDSFTYGASVEPDETFVHKVETLLNEGTPDGVVTINIGQPGTDPMAQADPYAAVREQIRPHVLVHVLYCNDLGHDLYDELKIIHGLQNRRSAAARLSRLWDLVEGRYRYVDVRRRTLDYFRGGDSPFKRRQSWTRLRSGIERCRELAAMDNATYVIVMFPWLYALDDYPLDDVHDGVRNIANELNAPFLDLVDVFRGRNADALRISATDEHPNAAAHDIAARAIADFLRSVLPRLPEDS